MSRPADAHYDARPADAHYDARPADAHRNAPARGRSRAQSSVVGVALLIGTTVVAVGLLTASTGVVVQGSLAAADTGHVTDAMAATVRPGPTGPSSRRLTFSSGRLRVVPRTVRVLDGSGVVDRWEAGALVFSARGRRVAALCGAVIRGTGSDARFRAPPPTAADAGALAVSVSRLNATGVDAVAGGDAPVVRLRTNVTRERRRLPAARYRLAVETSTPAVWEAYFGRQGATTSRRDFDGDGVTSVVARYPGVRTLDLAVSDLRFRMVVARG